MGKEVVLPGLMRVTAGAGQHLGPQVVTWEPSLEANTTCVPQGREMGAGAEELRVRKAAKENRAGRSGQIKASRRIQGQSGLCWCQGLANDGVEQSV